MPPPSRRRRSSSPSPPPPAGRRPTLRRPLSTSPFLLLASAAALLASPTPAAAAYPQIDLSKLGSVALGGSFSGLSFFDPSATASTSAASANVSLTASRSTVFSSVLSGSDEPLALAQTNDGGSVLALCLLPSATNASAGGTLFVGGSFDALASVGGTANVGAIDLDSGVVSPLAQGVDGAVHSLYCNGTSGDVWLGGAFSSATGASTGAGGRVLVWSSGASSFAAPSFDGFSSGAVESITPSADNSSLVFSGSFSTAYSSSALSSNSTTAANSTLPVPDTTVFSPGSTPFTASLTPVSLSSAGSITGSPSSSLAGFSDPAVLLCPQGADGAGASWFAGDGQDALLTVDLGQGAVSASGLRIANTFASSRGTATFSAVVLPNSQAVALSYVDPATGANETCTASCPLSANASVPFQDFLFEGGPADVSGFQLTLLSWTGDGPGLHFVELLSAGSYAPLPADQTNTTSCASLPTTGTTTTNGTWTTISAASSLGGVSSSALQASVDVSAFSPSSAPTLTYYPYVTGTGNYSVSLVVPGCSAVGDCAGRTSLDVTVQPYAGAGAFRQTIAPSRWAQTYELYRGAVQETTAAFSPVVNVSMPAAPVGINGEAYTAVVGRVELTLLTVDTTGSGAGSFPTADAQGLGGGYSNSTVSGPTPGASANASAAGKGFGVWQWAVGDGSVSTQGAIANGSLTAADGLAQALAAALGTAGSSTVEGAVELDDGSWVVAGTFSTAAWSNVVFSSSSGSGNTTATLAAPAGKGLNGAVAAVVAVGSDVYLGGSFSATVDGATTLARLAKYDSASSSWSALAGGVDGDVTSLALSADGESLVVGGDFATLLAANSSAADVSVGGFALYDLTAGGWATDQAAAVFGDVAAVSAPAAKTDQVFFAGGITGVAGQSAVGFALLTSDDGEPSIESFPLGFDGTPSSSSAAAAAAASSTATAAGVGRRAPHATANHSTTSFSGRQWLPSALVAPAVDVVRRAFTSAAQPVARAVSASSLASGSFDAPSVVAAAFWTNSSDANHKVLVLGGNFTSGASSDLLTYDESSRRVSALRGDAVDGAVLALEVVGNVVLVGGEFTGALRAYDLKDQAWDDSVPTLSASDGKNATVTTLLTRPSTSDVVTAGTFASAGSVSCASVCSWSTSDSAWSALGTGVDGSVASFAFAGDSSDELFVVGDFTLGGVQAYVGRYWYGNQSWAALEGGETVPGPATAVAVDDKKAAAVFVAGTSATDGSAYLLRWDGAAWSAVSAAAGASALTLGSSSVSQLAFVPLSASHDGGNTDVVGADRALLASGALALADYGSYSAAMFDGAQWFPYVRSTTGDGGAGSVRGLFNSERNFSFDIRSFLAVGIVVVICMAIALGVVFLAVLIGLLIALWRRNRRSNETQQLYPAYGKAEDSPYAGGAYGSDDGFDQDPHRAQMLHHINAATEGVIAGSAVGGGAAALAKHDRSHSRGMSSDEGYPTEETAADRGDLDDEGLAGAAGGAMSAESGEEVEARVAHARWSLTPDPGAERELKIKAGQPYLILNDADPEWWLAFDPSTGEQGAVPASWML